MSKQLNYGFSVNVYSALSFYSEKITYPLTGLSRTTKKRRGRGTPFEAPPWSLQRATPHKVFCGKYLYLLQKKASQYSYIASPFFLASPKYFLAVNCPFGLVRGGSLKAIPRTTKGRRPLESDYIIAKTACFLGSTYSFVHQLIF